MNKKDTERNLFDELVEDFADQGADTLGLLDLEHGMVTGVAHNSKTGETWSGMMIVSSIEDALKCKYPVVCRNEDKKLNKYVAKHRSAIKGSGV